MATEVVKKEFVRKSQTFFQFRHSLSKKITLSSKSIT